MKKGEQLTWLASDPAILEALVDAEHEGHPAKMVPGDFMPDGKPFYISMQGVDKLNANLIQSLVRIVRNQYHARENEQEAKASGDADARGSADGRKDGKTGRPRERFESATDNLSWAENSMEEILQSKIAILAERYREARERYVQLREQTNEAKDALAEVNRLIAEAETLREVLCTKNSQSELQQTSSGGERKEDRNTVQTESEPSSPDSQPTIPDRSEKQLEQPEELHDGEHTRQATTGVEASGEEQVPPRRRRRANRKR